jgi:release factor glutamine methyltransferase
MIYEAREDSFFLARYVRKFAKGKVLDMGTGSGILASAAAKHAASVIGADINHEAVIYCSKRYKKNNLRFVQSDLFSSIHQKFDVIIFNPPYLPDDARLSDLAVDGGKLGHELIERFLQQAKNFLKSNGCILLLFSSLTNQVRVHEILDKNLYVYKRLGEKKLFYEILYVYRIERSAVLKQLERKGVTNVEYFTKGHRGILFTGFLKKKKIVIKIKNPDSLAVGRIVNEAFILKRINGKGIGPKIILCAHDYFVYEYIPGRFIVDFFMDARKTEITKALTDILKQLSVLDSLGYCKEEMHHPLKHIIIGKKAVLIDFERCHVSAKPKNVTQFCQFLMNAHIHKLLQSRGVKINLKKLIHAAQEYKHDISPGKFKEISRCIS